MNRLLPKAVVEAQNRIGKRLKEGCTAVDATAGKGYDTVFLAKCVGESGRVYAFDLQEEAIKQTKQRLQRLGLSHRVILINTDHAQLRDYLKEPVDVMMFNLGYLPGGDHGLITRPSTTIAALEAGLSLLKPYGAISIVLYSGHPGGREEKEKVISYLTHLPQQAFTVAQYHFLNQVNEPPSLILVEKIT